MLDHMAVDEVSKIKDNRIKLINNAKKMLPSVAVLLFHRFTFMGACCFQATFIKAGSGQAVAALAAKARGLVVLGAAPVAFDHLQRGAAVVAELAFPGRLAALGADGLLAFDLAVENFGLGGFFRDILDHLARLGRSHLHINAGGALRAEAFLLVPVVKAYPLAAFRAALEMAFFLSAERGIWCYLSLFFPDN
jgi:hypothetical protein